MNLNGTKMVWQIIIPFPFSIQIHGSSASLRMSVGCSRVQVLGSLSYYLENKISPAAAMNK